MKKINFCFIFVIICLSLIKIIGSLDSGIVNILKDLSIILTVFIPYILKNKFHVNLGEGFIFIYLIFIFLAHYLGVICGYYNEWDGFDKLTHFLSGFLTSYVAVLIFSKSNGKGVLFGILFIISFTWMCAGLWEVFEFVCDNLFGGDALRVLETGVTDTMMDMIVAFVGSIIVTVYEFAFNRRIFYEGKGL